MDALLPVLIAVLLAETGSKTQRSAHDLSLKFGRPLTILSALMLSTLANLAVAAIGGAIVANLINFQARTLLAGFAILSSGLPMLFNVRPPRPIAGSRPFLTSLFAFIRAQFGDSPQFIVFAFAARANMAELALAAGWFATMVAGGMPVLLRIEWQEFPTRIARRIAAVILTATGFWMIISSLKLIG